MTSADCELHVVAEVVCSRGLLLVITGSRHALVSVSADSGLVSNYDSLWLLQY